MKVGDYVRTDDGCICKVLQYTEISDTDFYVNTDSPYNVIYKSWIVKSSPNIIDLIEVGDVLVVKDFVDEACMIFTDIYLIQNEQQLINIKSDLEKNKNKKLYSIVTSEQFSQMEYRIGE